MEDEEREENGFDTLRCLANDLNNGSVRNGDSIKLRSDEVAEIMRIRLVKRSARKKKRN